MNPVVSVCIPTYNGARYLAGCLESVLAQTYTDFEVIVADDSSTDDTVRIGRGYARGDSRVRVYEEEKNRGLVANWARCARLARGMWVKFVFQDDLILPGCLGELLAIGVKAGASIVSCARDFVFEPDTPEDERRFYLENKALITELYRSSNEMSAERFSEAALQWLGENLLGEPTAVLLHREVFERFGLLHPHLLSHGDLEYWVRVASNVGTVHVPEVLAMFRVGRSSITGENKQPGVRQYRAETVDRVLVLHDYAFHACYAHLRAVARRRRPRINLEDMFWSHALGARWLARRAAADRERPDRSLLDEWQEMARCYPRLKSIPLGHRIRSKWRALRKTTGAVDSA